MHDISKSISENIYHLGGIRDQFSANKQNVDVLRAIMDI